MDGRNVVKKPGDRARRSEGACALLAVLVLAWQVPAGRAQIHASGVAQAGVNGHGAEAAEKEYSEAAALSRKLTERDLHEALRLYRVSADEFRKAGARQRAAAAEVGTGNTLNMMSDYEQAIEAYRRALVLGGQAAQARCAGLTGLAWTEANMGRSTDAVRDAGEAVAACAPIKDADARAYERAVEAEGEAEFWSAHVENATAILTQARQLAAAAGDSDGEALSTMLLAENVHPDDQEAAHRLIANAMDLWHHNGNVYGAARGDLALAYFAGREGKYAAAECESRRALAVFERVADNDNAAVAFNVLGMVARRSGDLKGAADAYRHAQTLFVVAKDELGEGEAVSGLMDVSVDRNDTTNPGLYARGLTLAKTTQNKALLATALVGTGDVMLRRNRFTLAQAEYRKAFDAAQAAANPYEEALALGRLAKITTAKGDLDEALDLHAQAQALEDQSGAIEDVARTQYLRARIYLAKRDPQNALGLIEKTVAIIEQQRLRIAKFESRAQYFAWVHEYYAFYIRVLMALDRIDPGRKYATRAFQASERSKVRALLDELTKVPEAVNCDNPLMQTTQPEAMSASAKPEDVPPSPPSDTDAGVWSVEQIQAEMEAANATLVEFAIGEEQSVAWLLDGQRISAFQLGHGAEIRRRVARFRQAMEPLEPGDNESPEEFLRRRDTQRRAIQRQSREIGHMLFGAMPLPIGKRLIIVPDGALQYLPFASLAMASGTPLVEYCELAMLPSAAALPALRNNANDRPAPRDEVVVIADPVYERQRLPAPQPGRIGGYAPASAALVRSPELTRALRDLHKAETIPSLPGSRLEALNIQKILGPSHTRLALGFDASRDAVLRGVLSQARVVHFATHGILDAKQPENSGLVLSLFMPAGLAQDGYLRVNDINRLKLSADLVVLSSCESGLGKDLGSEGIIGLPHAFLQAGARRVIASLWKVDDEAAAALMTSFYQALKGGSSPAAALGQAQRRLRRNPRFQDPYFWAAFFLEGEYL
jgi:CHAT domain-containing protein